MSDMRTIEIDFDVHRAIEMERRGFDEPANAALRRLLKLGEPKQETPKSSLPEGRPWSGKGVTLPHGTELRMDYNGRVYTGHIDNGIWAVEGKKFDSPSGSASAVGITKKGTTTRLDGWVLWQVKRPGDARFRALSGLRPA